MAGAPTAKDDDDDATSVDPPRKSAEPDADDDATKATGTPKKAREAQRILEESRKLNAAGGPKTTKKMHPLVPIGIALAIVAVFLLILNAMLPSSGGAAGEQGAGDERSGIRRLFDW